MAIFADTSTYTLAYAIESTFDEAVTGSGGAYKLLRNTGESMNTSLESARSDEIDSSRQYTGSVHVSGASAGSVNFQLSYGEYDEFLQAVLQSADWATAYTDTVTDIATKVLTGITSTTGLVIGQSVKIAGLTETTEDGVYTIKSVNSSTSITLVEAITDEAAGSITIDTNGHIVNGSTQRSYTFEKDFQVDGTSNYFAMSGMRASSLSMSFAAGSILSGEIAFQGATGVGSDATPQDSGGYQAAGTNELMNSVSNVNGLAIDAVDIAGDLTNIPVTFQEMSISLNNNMRDQSAIGNLFPAGIGSGRIDVEATATLYFSDQNIFDKFIINDSVQLRFQLEDGAGNAYGFILPELKIASHEVTASGADADVMASVTFAGIKDARFGTESSILITRMVA